MAVIILKVEETRWYLLLSHELDFVDGMRKRVSGMFSRLLYVWEDPVSESLATIVE